MKLDYMTKISGVPGANQAVSGMAYFSETGPYGAICSKCQFYVSDGSANERRCRKYFDMLHAWGAKIRKRQSACKYFEQKLKTP